MKLYKEEISFFIREIVQRDVLVMKVKVHLKTYVDSYIETLVIKVFESHLENLGLRDMPHLF